jgi:hypothetical protein
MAFIVLFDRKRLSAHMNWSGDICARVGKAAVTQSATAKILNAK